MLKYSGTKKTLAQMAKFLREKVSKNKNRYRQDGFDLDLTYITDRIIAMGFPSSSQEAMYRNPLPEVQKFYEQKHPEKYKLYNLCAERKYDESKFHGRVAQYPFYDHNAPPVSLIADCCRDIHDWLSADPENIVGINCKAGKGRTGLIICCYLLHSGQCQTTDEALKFYGERRTKDGKGVTIASQQRYIRYYEEVLTSHGRKVPPTPSITVDKLMIQTPKITGPFFAAIAVDNEEVFRSSEIIPQKKRDNFEIPMGCCSVEGDCNILICAKRMGSELVKSTIDVANKDKKNKVFKEDFAIELFFKSDGPSPSSPQITTPVSSPRSTSTTTSPDKDIHPTTITTSTCLSTNNSTSSTTMTTTTTTTTTATTTTPTASTINSTSPPASPTSHTQTTFQRTRPSNIGDNVHKATFMTTAKAKRGDFSPQGTSPRAESPIELQEDDAKIQEALRLCKTRVGEEERSEVPKVMRMKSRTVSFYASNFQLLRDAGVSISEDDDDEEEGDDENGDEDGNTSS